MLQFIVDSKWPQFKPEGLPRDLQKRIPRLRQSARQSTTGSRTAFHLENTKLKIRVCDSKSDCKIRILPRDSPPPPSVCGYPEPKNTRKMNVLKKIKKIKNFNEKKHATFCGQRCCLGENPSLKTHHCSNSPLKKKPSRRVLNTHTPRIDYNRDERFDSETATVRRSVMIRTAVSALATCARESKGRMRGNQGVMMEKEARPSERFGTEM